MDFGKKELSRSKYKKKNGIPGKMDETPYMYSNAEPLKKRNH
jgi:hypothetical protein